MSLRQEDGRGEGKENRAERDLGFRENDTPVWRGRILIPDE